LVPLQIAVTPSLPSTPSAPSPARGPRGAGDPAAARTPRRAPSQASRRLPLVLALLALLGTGAVAPRGDPLPAGRAPETVVALQPFRRTRSIEARDGAGRRGRATLIDLDPAVHAWLLLELEWEGAAGQVDHLENPDPEHQRVELDPGHPSGVVLVTEHGRREPCDLWSAAAPGGGLAQARASEAPYASLCEGRLYLRHAARGRRTAKEWAAELLRDHVWGGEKITEVVRDALFRDAWMEPSRLDHDGERERRPAGAPDMPRLAPGYDDKLVDPAGLGLDIPREAGGMVGVGHWYPVRDEPGVFVSVVTPGAITPDVMKGVAHRVNPLDPIESKALVDLVAFDLSRFDVGFALGTEHPRVGWSDRVQPSVRDPALPGPDGIDTIAPLVRTGMLSPAEQGRAAATFTGGFKRLHGAMRWGALAQVNHGSHYGFVEEGVILSRLQPGLATAVVFADGRVDLRTWRARDDRELEQVRFARQNGVPLIEPDPASGRPGPGALVTQWGPGNWSGSEDKRLRTLRAGLCLLDHGGHHFLAYGWFSSATPSAMATVFQGYGCRYAMLLDMNALEHTYLALYHRDDDRLLVEHLIDGMNVLDKQTGDQTLPRFVGFPDNRDFFYLLRRTPP
jgi:hypothetical protein